MGSRWLDTQLGRWTSPDTIMPDLAILKVAIGIRTDTTTLSSIAILVGMHLSEPGLTVWWLYCLLLAPT